MIKSKHIPTIIAVSVGILTVAVGIISVFLLINSPENPQYDKKDFIDPDTYQAVFLNNDQIYFGHLKDLGLKSGYLLLADVYYVKVDDSGAGQLVKLGKIEPHAPVDEMVINQEHILFWENLKSDSPVIKTIKNIQSQ